MSLYAHKFENIILLLHKIISFCNYSSYNCTPSTFRCQFIFVFTFVDYERSTYGDYVFPVWADALGWILACLVIVPIVITALYRLYKEDDPIPALEVARRPFCLFRLITSRLIKYSIAVNLHTQILFVGTVRSLADYIIWYNGFVDKSTWQYAN